MPVAQRVSSGVACGSVRRGAARVEAAPDRRIMSGGRPGMTCSRRASAARAGARRASSASRVRHPRLAQQRRGRRPLDDASGVHHRDLVGQPGDDAEVVADEDHRHAAPRAGGACGAGEDLRLHRHVERRRRLVGDQQVRLARRCAMAIAMRWRMPAGQLVRVLAQAGARARGCRPARAARRPAAAPSASADSPSSRSTSAIWRPMRTTGLSDDNGFCGTMPMPRPPHPAQFGRATSPAARRRRDTPARRTGRGAAAAGCRMIDRVRTLLPEPDSPTMPSVLPRSSSKLDVGRRRARTPGVGATRVVSPSTLSSGRGSRASHRRRRSKWRAHALARGVERQHGEEHHRPPGSG